jgi:hypothetical protein
MDMIVTSGEGGTIWQLTNLLGRSMGRIAASAPRQLLIYSEGHARHTAKAVPSLDVALAEIERRTRGVCPDLASQYPCVARYPYVARARSQAPRLPS